MIKNTQPKFIDKFFKDKHGKWAIIQWPNILLWLWIATIILNLLMQDGHLKEGLKLLQSSLIFAWACLEAIDGASYFRKLLGVIVLVVVLSGYFI